MGTSKALLPWPPSDSGVVSHPSRTTAGTVIATSFDILAPHCECMFVVVGSNATATAIAGVMDTRRYTAVLSDPDAQMLESVRAGLRVAFGSRDVQAALVLPVDHPRVQATTVTAILEAWTQIPNRAVMPEFHGKGGHPVVIPKPLWPSIEAFHADGGLRAFWHTHPETCVRLIVDDHDCVQDFDTPADYADLL